jgi:putative transferase (TIGR04331 family)
MPEAKPYYELLRNVGILADTPEQAAEFVVLHWDNLEGWWESKKVQDVRREFCQQYARTEKNPIRKLKKILTSVYW